VDGLTESSDVGQFSSIALDSSDNPHISYYKRISSDQGDLKYATKASGSWVTEWVDGLTTEDKLGRYTSIALDSSGYAHISYYDATNGDLKYATNASGSWVTEPVDWGGDVGQHTSIALDSSGYAHISYWDVSNGDLKYARQPCHDEDEDTYFGESTCTDPGPKDCNDTNENIYPTNSNIYCDCEGEIQQGVAENCSGGIDEDCDGLIDDADPDCGGGTCAGSAEASTYEASPVYGASELGRNLAWLLLPVGMIIGLGIWRRKR
jgi:hypothetical protein